MGEAKDTVLNGVQDPRVQMVRAENARWLLQQIQHDVFVVLL